MVFQQKFLEKADFIVKMTGLAMVWQASSDKWKAPLLSSQRCIGPKIVKIFL